MTQCQQESQDALAQHRLERISLEADRDSKARELTRVRQELEEITVLYKGRQGMGVIRAVVAGTFPELIESGGAIQARPGACSSCRICTTLSAPRMAITDRTSARRLES